VRRAEKNETSWHRYSSGLIRITVCAVCRTYPHNVYLQLKQIKLEGNDHEGVQERQDEWSRWAEDLPKIATENQQNERAGDVTPSEKSVELGAEEAKGKKTEDTDIKSPLRNDTLREDQVTGEHPLLETRTTDKDEEAMKQGRRQHAWASTMPWEWEHRVVPSKLGVGEKGMPERPGAGASQSVHSGDSRTPYSGGVDQDAIEAGSDPQSDKEGGHMSAPVSGDISDLIEHVEAFENRLGVRLAGLFAKIDSDGDIRVYGELHSRNSAELNQDVEVVVTVYDSSGRVVGVDETLFDSDSFFGFEAFSALLLLEGIRPARIRVYPKAR
jgi:hypothetical protein